ncbi:MAG: peptidoglycan bridge formation glycyltransferase FemA/FemB family protein [Bacteroidetes bacterium]|nr:peptidoglycan bridge formation glycyltransferase FemA/FemB family protein [Bacteroidota bacterium]
MIVFRNGFALEKWFADGYEKSDMLLPRKYKQCRVCCHSIMVRCDKFYTKIINMRRSEEDIYNSFNKTTRYDISKASKSGVAMRIIDDYSVFIRFYNVLAEHKGLKKIRSLSKYNDKIVITAAYEQDAVLVMHAYICDNLLGRVRLLYSCSHYRSYCERNMQAVIGSSNKYLHYEDIKYFKSRGYVVYDFGGYAYESKDMDLKNINKFKDGFGGELEVSYECKTYVYLLIEKIYKYILACGIA